jgi:hypothetical protein
VARQIEGETKKSWNPSTSFVELSPISEAHKTEPRGRTSPHPQSALIAAFHDAMAEN